MNFIYAIDKAATLNARVLGDTGLGGILKEPSRVQTIGSTIGPNGPALLCGNVEVKRLKYLPDEQVWMAGYNGKYHVGFYSADPPDEKDLRREKQLAGHKVELPGGEWLIPIARKFDGGSTLPATLILTADGKVVSERLEEFAAFGAAAEIMFSDTLKASDLMEGNIELDVAARIKLAVEALGLNYHVGVEEVMALKLIGSHNLVEITEAIIDMPALVAVAEEMKAAKKKEVSASTHAG